MAPLDSLGVTADNNDCDCTAQEDTLSRQQDFARRIRKVRSLDFSRMVMAMRRETHHDPNHDDNQDGTVLKQPPVGASRFSVDAQKGQYPIRRRSAARLGGTTAWRRRRQVNALAEEQAYSLTDLHNRTQIDHHHHGTLYNIASMLKRMLKIPLRVGFLSVSLLAIMTVVNIFTESTVMMNDLSGSTTSSPLSVLSLFSHSTITKGTTASTSTMAAPFRSHTKPTLDLGTAAISAVTEALGPILPFTGGVDLRREEHWDTTHGWYYTATNMIDQVRDAFGWDPLPSVGGVANGRQPQQQKRQQQQRQRLKIIPTKHVAALSSNEPFVSLESIAAMTLQDLTLAFQYATTTGRDGFDERSFLRQQQSRHPRMTVVLKAMKEAVAKSRGDDVLPAAISSTTTPGQVDALQFAAAMRLFAEWRVVRQVPEGYKGYAVGMNLGLKDVVQNLAKIEQAAHEWIDYRRALLSLQGEWDEGTCPTTAPTVTTTRVDCELRSPTLRDLLQHEADTNVHQRLPRLRDKTAAMGLLWVRRQLDYQTAVFANVVRIPSRYATATEAITAAYQEVYDRYHGWAVQKIFQYSFAAAPAPQEIYKFMNPHRLQAVLEEVASREEVVVVVTKDEGSMQERQDKNPFQQFGDHVANEWGKLVEGLFGNDNDNNNNKSNKSDQTILTADPAIVDVQVEEAMTKDAHGQIKAYLGTVQGLLADLAALFVELNMDDPTRV